MSLYGLYRDFPGIVPLVGSSLRYPIYRVHVLSTQIGNLVTLWTNLARIYDEIQLALIIWRYATPALSLGVCASD